MMPLPRTRTPRTVAIAAPEPLVVLGDAGPLRIHADLGELAAVRVGGRALARDVAEDRAARAALLAREGAVLCLAGAAWVHGGPGAGPRPPRPEHTGAPWLRNDSLSRHLVLETTEITRLGGCLLTTPARTALDVARFLEHDEAVYWLLVLAEAGHPIETWHRDRRMRRRGGAWPQAERAFRAAILWLEGVSRSASTRRP